MRKREYVSVCVCVCVCVVCLLVCVHLYCLPARVRAFVLSACSRGCVCVCVCTVGPLARVRARSVCLLGVLFALREPEDVAEAEVDEEEHGHEVDEGGRDEHKRQRLLHEGLLVYTHTHTHTHTHTRDERKRQRLPQARGLRTRAP